VINLPQPVEEDLKLEEFRTLYRYYRRYVRVFDYLLLGFLVWIESKVIVQRVSNTVDQALDEYVVPPMPDMVTPIYTEQPSSTSIARSEQATRLPEMRLTAPWYIDTKE
jgi:hypothetical protein